MKRVFSLILIAVLLLLPITSYATEEAPDVPSPSISGEVVPTLEPTPSLPDASIPEIDTSDDVITPELPDTKDTNEATSDESASTSESSAEESTPAEEESESNEAENSESTETENSESTEEITDNNEESEDHLHDFLYTSNGDGTHTVTCTSRVHIYDPNDSDSIIDEKDCDYYEVENCTFEKGICIYCGYIEETDFNPDVSITLLNESCNIGFSNPIICLDISQKYYDISYAQVCFANYEKRKFINVGLAQKKYFDSDTNEFVYLSDDAWYASPDITEDYATGDYSLRSIYIRSTDGDTVHYSLESDSLPDNLKNNTITVNPPLTVIENIYDSIFNPVEDIPLDLSKGGETISTDDSLNSVDDGIVPIIEPAPENIKHETDLSEPIYSEPVVEEPEREEPTVDDSDYLKPLKKEPNFNESKISPTLDVATNSNPETATEANKMSEDIKTASVTESTQQKVTESTSNKSEQNGNAMGSANNRSNSSTEPVNNSSTSSNKEVANQENSKKNKTSTENKSSTTTPSKENTVNNKTNESSQKTNFFDQIFNFFKRLFSF